MADSDRSQDAGVGEDHRHGDASQATMPLQLEDSETLSPSKVRFEEFSGLIAQTEASMRSKLSMLTMPQSDVSSDSESDQGAKLVSHPHKENLPSRLTLASVETATSVAVVSSGESSKSDMSMASTEVSDQRSLIEATKASTIELTADSKSPEKPSPEMLPVTSIVETKDEIHSGNITMKCEVVKTENPTEMENLIKDEADENPSSGIIGKDKVAAVDLVEPVHASGHQSANAMEETTISFDKEHTPSIQTEKDISKNVSDTQNESTGAVSGCKSYVRLQDKDNADIGNSVDAMKETDKNVLTEMGNDHMTAELEAVDPEKKVGIQHEAVAELGASKSGSDAVTIDTELNDEKVEESVPIANVTCSLNDPVSDTVINDAMHVESDEMDMDYGDCDPVSVGGTELEKSEDCTVSVTDTTDNNMSKSLENSEVAEPRDKHNSGTQDGILKEVGTETNGVGIYNAQEHSDESQTLPSVSQKQDAEDRGSVDEIEQAENVDTINETDCGAVNDPSAGAGDLQVGSIKSGAGIAEVGSGDKQQNVMETDECTELNNGMKVIAQTSSDTPVDDVEASGVKKLSHDGVRIGSHISEENCSQSFDKVCEEVVNDGVDVGVSEIESESGNMVDPSASEASTCNDGGLLITNVRSLCSENENSDLSKSMEGMGNECTSSTNEDRVTEGTDQSDKLSSQSVRNNNGSLQIMGSTTDTVAASTDTATIAPSPDIALPTGESNRSCKQILVTSSSSSGSTSIKAAGVKQNKDLTKNSSCTSSQNDCASNKSSGEEQTSLPVISNVFSVKQEVLSGDEYPGATPAETVCTSEKTVSTLDSCRVLKAWKICTTNSPQNATTVGPVVSISSSNITVVNKQTGTLQQIPVNTIISTAQTSQNGTPVVAATPAVVKKATISQDGKSVVAATPAVLKKATINQDGKSVIAATPAVLKKATVSQDGKSVIAATPAVLKKATISQDGKSVIAATPAVLKKATVSQSGKSVIAVTPAVLKKATVNQNGKSVIAAAPSVLKQARAIAIGTEPQTSIVTMKAVPQSAPIIFRFTKPGKTVIASSTPEIVKPVNAEKTPIPTMVSKEKESVLNIDTVGATKITELIARKNPIPVFKPDPPPRSVKNYRTYPCYECGDSFSLEDSLAIHTKRCSMKLTYKCDFCKKKVLFTNKCQLLGHLRFHMNLDKSRAVPIHIKSDSIEIRTFVDDIVKGKEYKWHNFQEGSFKDDENVSTKTVADKSQNATKMITCYKCSLYFGNLGERAVHFQGNAESKTYFCPSCPMYLKSECALSAHQHLHALATIPKIKVLVCPECGETFKLADVQLYLDHIQNVCFHLSRLSSFRCVKCQALISSVEGIEQHLLLNMEHYYKCELCPMALKNLATFQQHFHQKHGDVEVQSHKRYAKIIYRCHICDSLMDDRAFLTSHMINHQQTIKSTAFERFHCLKCGQNFMSRKMLITHFKVHQTSSLKRRAFCTFCVKTFATQYAYVQHTIATHSRCLPTVYAQFCPECGLVYFGHAQYLSHACLAGKKIKVLGDDSVPKSKMAAAKQKRATISSQNATLTESEAKELELLASDIPPGLSKRCKYCGLVFKSAGPRVHHIRSHRDEDVFMCIWCDRLNFSNYHDLRSHEIACEAMMKKPEEAKTQKKRKSNKQATPDKVKAVKQEAQPEDSFQCEHCSLVFTRQSLQEEHMKSEHGFHPCHLCGLIFQSQTALKKHITINHEGKKLVYYCWVCRGRKIYRHFSERSRLEKHLGVKHRLKNWDESKIVAELPGREGSGGSPEPKTIQVEENKSPEASPAMKKLRVEGEALFKCAKCSFTSETKEPFLKHISEHKAEDTVQCFECGLCFAVFSSLKKHLFMVHKIRDFETYLKENKLEEADEECIVEVDDVEREPIKQEPIDESSEEETGDPLECKVCYKMFDNEHILRSHMRTHGMAFIKKTRRRTSSILQKNATADVGNGHDVEHTMESANRLGPNDEGVRGVDQNVLEEPEAKRARMGTEFHEK